MAERDIPLNAAGSPYTYEEMKARQRALGPTGPSGPLGEEPDYNAPALEPETTSVAPTFAANPPASTPPRTPYETRLNNYREKIYWPEYHKHIANQIKRLYPAIPADAADDEVVSRYKQAFAPDMSEEDFYAKLDETHAKGWTPSTEAPKPNLIDTAQMVATPENAAEMGKSLAHFGGGIGVAKVGESALGRAGTLPAWMRAGWGKAPAVTSLGRVAGQGAMLLPTGIKLAAAQLGGTSMQRTAEAMPEPNVAVLQAKGYSPAQIANVIQGYTKVQKELYSEMEKFGQEGVAASAEGIANTALFGFGGKSIESTVGRLMGGKALAKTGAGTIAKSIAGGALAHTATGATMGGGYGAVHGATARMAEAKAAGLGANDIFTAGITGAQEEGIPGAVLGGILGGTLGTPGAVFSTMRAATKGASVARQAVAEAQADAALRINLSKFAGEFRPNELSERFPEDLAAAAGNDVALAQNIVSGVWGPEVAATEHGQQATSVVYEKILAWRNTREKLMGNMVDLPRPVETPVGLTSPMLTPEQQAMGLETTATPAPSQGNVPTLPGLVAPQPGVEVPQPHVVGEYRPTPEMQPAPAPEGVVPMKGLQPPGAAVPAPVRPMVLEGVQPTPPEGTPAPQLGKPLGPVEQGGQALPPVPEIAPRLPVVPPPAPAPTVLPASVLNAPRGSTGEIVLPTHAQSAIKALGEHEHVVLGTDAEGKYLKIEKLGVTVGTLAEPGASSDALAHVNAIADEHGLPVEAHVTPQAGPRGGTIPLEKLLPWYEKHGYQVTSQGEGWATVRRAPSEGAIAARVEGLPAEKAGAAAGNVTLGQPMAHADFGERLGKFLDTQAEAARGRITKRGVRLSAGLDPTDLADHSIVLAAEMFTKGMRTKTAVSNWLIETYGEVIRPHISAIYERAKARLVKMFVSDARAVKKLNEFTALRDTGSHGANWYEETANWVNKTFGPEDSDMFLRFLALTSADSSTEGGANLAMKAFAQWKNGLPFDGMRGPHMVKMLSEAVRGETFGGDKVQSFYQALRGDENAVVLDRWMIHALGLPIKKGQLGENDYKLYSQIVRNLAGDANMSPRQLQAAIWEGARVGSLHERWKSGGAQAVSKVGSARPLEQLLEKEFGGRTPYQWVEQNHLRLDDLTNMTTGMKAAKEQGGYTFDPATWKADATPGYVVTLASDVVPREKFYPAALTKFKSAFRRVITESTSGPHLNIGVFDLKDYKPGHYSMDLNVVIPNTGPEALAKAIEIGKLNRQFEVGEIGVNGEYVQGHKTGYDPKKHGPQFVPPAKGPARSTWFKGATARARTLLDRVEFSLTSQEGIPRPVISAAPTSMETRMAKLLKTPLDPKGTFNTGRRSGEPVWLTPSGAAYAGRSHEFVSNVLTKAAKLTEKKIGYKGTARWDNHALLQNGFARVQINPDKMSIQIVGEPSASQRATITTMAKGRDFNGVLTNFDGTAEQGPFQTPAKLFGAAKSQ